MDRTVVVTSFSDEGLKVYGERFLYTFALHWSQEVDLVVYHEGACTPGPWRNVNLLEVQSCAEFMVRHKDSPLVQGREYRTGDRWKATEIQCGYNFRYDAYKFARKVFAIADAARSVESGTRLIWLDADIYTYRPVTNELLEAVVPSDVDISFLARRRYHSECGFVGYNIKEDGCALRFIQEFERQYAEDAFFRWREWHDSFVFDELRNVLHPSEYRIPNKGKSDPLDTSPLGECMVHLKGNRKYETTEVAV